MLNRLTLLFAAAHRKSAETTKPVHEQRSNALRPGQTLETRVLPHPSQQAWVRPCPYGLAASLPGTVCFPGGLFPVARRADSPEVF